MIIKTLVSLVVVLSFVFLTALSWADMGKDAMPLKAAAGSKADQHITEGIEHYEKGHWDVAQKHFTEAAKADPKSAEAHYDVALVLDKMGDHAGATQHFKTAYDLGKDNPNIQSSEILKKHLKM
jgi:Tfp pilus assembly protein PilF